MPITHELNSDASIQPNSAASVQGRVADGRISWTGPLILVCLRTLLLIVGQACVAWILRELRHPRPWREAGDWWAVYGTLADVGCLVALRFFTRREGIRMRDLLGPIRLRRGYDLYLGLGYYLLLLPIFLASTFLARQWLFSSNGNALTGLLMHMHPLPLWASLYGVSVWWMLWSPTEEATYQAYCLPRLQSLSGRPWPAILMVGFFWAAQHCALPLYFDGRYVIFRFLAFFPGVVAMMLLYLRTKRLTPMIFAHWPLDIFAAIIHVLY
jgi:CAAX prenyl protease-like protein